MRIFRLVMVLLLLAASGMPASADSSAADAAHVHVQLLAPAEHLYPDQLYPGRGQNQAGIYFKLEKGWHIYWKNPGDAGQPPHVRWTLPQGIGATPLQFPAPRRLSLGSLTDFGYEDEVLFPLAIKVANGVKPGPVTLHAHVDWLVCREICIPGKAELEVSRNLMAQAPTSVAEARPDAEIFRRLLDRLPKPLPTASRLGFRPSKEGFRLTVETGQREMEATFFPQDEDILDNSAPQKLEPTSKGLVLELKKDANLRASPARLKGVLELAGGRAFEIVALPGLKAAQPIAESATNAAERPENLPPEAQKSGNSPKIEHFSAGQGEALKALLRVSGLAFLGGMLLNFMPCVFPVLFLKGLALARSGSEEWCALRAHGFVYAGGILASFWLLVAVLLALREAGMSLGWGFQFQSPVFLALMAGLLFFLGLSLAGQFEIGLTLTSAGGSLAARSGYMGSFFTGVLAVVVATPCTAPFMGAALGYALAQSAAVSFTVFTALALGLAAPYVALTLQPAWTRYLPHPGVWMEVLRQAVSVPIFATVIWLAWVLARTYGAAPLASLLASFLLLAIAGWFLGRWPAKRWSAAVAAAILLGVVALAVFSQHLAQAGSQTGAAPSGEVSQADLDSAAAGEWAPWSAAAVERYRAEGRPVFVDFTASWCLSCQVNERVALGRPEVKQAFRTANVVLLRADWTRHDEAITQALASLGRSGVPAYALYLPGENAPRLLPEILTPGIVLEALGR